MDKLSLYKFVEDNNIEYHWWEGDVIMFVPFGLLSEWSELLGYAFLSDEGAQATMKSNDIVFEMSEICEYFDIYDEDMREIFNK